jgi:hypothetical protein
MTVNTEKIIKIALSVLLLICLFHMPYGYYQLFRYIAVVGFAMLAYYEFERKNIIMAIMFVALAFLFQPFSKVPLGRQSWIIIDIVAAGGLILSVFLHPAHPDK